jgi:hypothetical protein
MNIKEQAESWIDRDTTEQRLVSLCEIYDTVIRDTYLVVYDQDPGAYPGLNVTLRWAISVGLVTSAEDTTWRKAMVLRNAILQREFRIVLADIRHHIDAVRPIVEALPKRASALINPPPASP